MIAFAEQWITMTIFYTHVLYNTGLVTDDFGAEFASFEDARSAALRAGGKIVADEIAKGRGAVTIKLLIRNAAGELLTTVPITGRRQSRR